MPAAHDAIIIDGTLALETNVSQHSGDPHSFRVFRDLVTDAGRRILKRDGRGAALGSIAGTEVQALFEYVFVDPTNGVETYHTLGAIDGGSYIYRWNGVTTWAGQTLPITPTPGGRWGFAATGPSANSVFAFNGKDALLIGQQPSSRLSSLTSAGVTATATTAGQHAFVTGDLVTLSGAAQAPYNGAFVITVTGPTTFTYTFAGSGTSPATGTIVASTLATVRWRIAGVDAPTFAPTYSLITNDPPYTIGTVSGVQGSPTIRSTVGPTWDGGTMNGKRIGINGDIYTISTVDVGGGVTDQVLTLTEGYKGATPPAWAPKAYDKGNTVQPTASVVGAFTVTGNGLFYECTTAGAAAGVEPAWPTVVGNTVNDGTAVWTCRAGWSYAILVGAGDWDDTAPQYRFSYYDPITGHVSNPSPVLQVTEVNQQGKTITVTIPASAENQAAYLNGYTQIQLFRTPKNAGICVALNEKLANVNSAATTIVYVETATKFRDTYLTDFQAPLLNFKPPAGISAMAFQQGRGWAVHRPSGHVRFTPIGLEVDFGRAIECWPPLYQLEVAAPRGLVVVGGRSVTDSLVIQTARGDYSVDGFNSVTFTPYGLQTNESGSYFGAAATARGRLFSYYADNKMLTLQDDIGQKIQDRLNLVKPSLIASVRLHWFSANSRNYLLLSIPKGSASTANDCTYVFDLDLPGGPIYEWNFGISAFATVHDAGTLALQLMIGDPSGAAYRLFSGVHQDAGVNFAPTWLTGVIRGEELRDDVKYVKLFVNDAQLTGPAARERATLWTGTLFINEQNDPNATNGEAVAMTFRQLDYRRQSAQGRELIWTPTVSLRTKTKAFQIGGTFPNVDAALWIEKIVIGSDIDQTFGVTAFAGGPMLGGKQA